MKPISLDEVLSTEDLILWWKANMRNDGDNVIVLDGDEGSGKSVLAWQLAHLLDSTFDPLKQILIAQSDFTPWLDMNAARNKTLVFDEGGNMMMSRDFATKESKRLVKILMQMRQVNSTVFILCPNMHWLDVYVREHRAKTRIHVYRRGDERGFAHVQVRRGSWRQGTTWWEDLPFVIRYPDMPVTYADSYAEYKRRKSTVLANQARQD